MSTSLTFITGNPSKAEQLGWYLGTPVAHRSVDLPEIPSLDLEEIVRHKAMEAFRVVGTPVLVEDTSLTFHALGKLPGPFIKWFLNELDNAGLCRMLQGYDDRSALAEVLFGTFDGATFKSFSGQVEGSIADAPRGSTDFGWDPIFIPDGYSKTWGEMTKEEKMGCSMRAPVLKKLEAELHTG